jgi:homoserine kinase type II
MPVCRLPGREELAAFLATRAIPLPDQVSLLGERVGSTRLSLVTGRGRFVLTLYEGFPRDEAEAFTGLQQQLARQGFPCTAPIADRDGHRLGTLAGRPAALFAYIEDDGHSLASPAAVGELLARLHLLGAELDYRRPNPRGADWMLATAASIADRLPDADCRLIDEELEYLSRHSRLSLPAGVIHADLFPDNLRVVDGAIRALIGFEFSCHEVLLFDIAVAINACCSRDDGRLDRLAMRDLLAAYSVIRPLAHEENLAIPMMLRATALGFWLSRLQESLQPVEGESIPRKPPREFRRMLVERRKPLSGMQ